MLRRTSRLPLAAGLAALAASVWLTSIGCSGEDENQAAPPDAANTPDAGGSGEIPLDGATDAPQAAKSPGCGRDALAGQTTTRTVTVGGRERSFRVHVPATYAKDESTPVVVMLHGGGGSGEQLETASSKMNPIADRERFIAVYPNGSGIVRTWNGGNCCGKAVEDGIDDVAFVRALLDDLEASHCVDTRRVHAMGMSNGAILGHRLACELSDRIAAVAAVAGTIGVPTCTPAQHVAVMTIHGTDDRHVPWDGGVGCGPSNTAYRAVPETIEGWRERNGCAETTTSYAQQGDGTCVVYEGCTKPVVLCTILGGGHSWPGGEPKEANGNCPEDGAQSATFIASEAAWSFFAANPKTP